MPSVQTVERPFFPLDEQLALLPGGLMPFMHECLVRLGTWMPFEKAAQLLEEILGVQVSPGLATRYTEAAGAAYVDLQTAEAERIEREAPVAPAGANQIVVSADGAMVPLRAGEWAEVKTLAVGAVQTFVPPSGDSMVQTRDISYFSRLVNAEQFEHLTLVEIHRRGLEHCQQVAAVTDGAEWLQSWIDYHCPTAVRILDFPHAAQRIAQIGQVLWGEDTPVASAWIAARWHQLKHQGPLELLAELRSLHQQHPQWEVLTENLAYLEKRESQMNYPVYQAQGWPIGSGMVESGNKLVVEVRLKGAGMHWRRENVNPMLGLRNIVCSDRWSTEWPLITQQLRREAQQRRRHHRNQRPVAPEAELPQGLEAPPVEIPQESPVVVHDAPAELPEVKGPKKPSANHPWRRGPAGLPKPR